MELYDLVKDIGERTNLAKSSPEIAGRCKIELVGWLQETGAAFPTRRP